MQDLLVQEVLRKQAIYAKLSKQLDKIVPRLIKKANRQSAKGRPIDVEVSIRPYFAIISTHPLKNYFFREGVKEAEIETQQWIIDEADRRLKEAGSSLEALFLPVSSFIGIQSPNKVGARLPDN